MLYEKVKVLVSGFNVRYYIQYGFYSVLVYHWALAGCLVYGRCSVQVCVLKELMIRGKSMVR